MESVTSVKYTLVCPRCQRRVGVLSATVAGWCRCKGTALRSYVMKLVTS